MLLGMREGFGIGPEGDPGGYAILAGAIQFFAIGYLLDLAASWLRKKPSLR
jgi:hypothetical protein